MIFDLNKVPFSRYGSYFAFSHFRRLPPGVSSNDLYLRTVHGDEATLPLFRLDLVKEGKTVPFKEISSPSLLRLEADDGYAEICISEPDVIRIRSCNVGLRLGIEKTKGYQNAYAVGEKRYEVNAYSHKLMLTPIRGTLSMNAPWEKSNCRSILADFLPDADGVMECAVEEFLSVWKQRGYTASFDSCVLSVKEEFEKWLDRTPEVSGEYGEERELAAYVNWSAVVRPCGHIKHDVMYMSKNWMANVWSWDYCFNAMALIKKNPKQAWMQFMYLTDYQAENGTLPDSVNDRIVRWNFVKPPIQGWALEWMMERSDFIGETQLKQIYGPLCKWTDWWMKYRDSDGDGLPEYNHGNDSGWDNATIFNYGSPIESPDLAAFLVIQMDVLSKIAQKLNLSEGADSWKGRSESLLRLMTDRLWKTDTFVAPHSGNHEIYPSNSLIVNLPVILGKRLPEKIRNALVRNLRENFLTDFGLATENLKSEFYEPDGYWRGPIWAPPTMLIADGLVRSGETELSRLIAKKFCELVKKSGMSENFDAISGAALRDPAYTWTSSIFLILANEYL